MNDNQVIRRFIDSFRRYLLPRLQPGFRLDCRAIPSNGPGAILEFTVAGEGNSAEQFQATEPTVNAGLAQIEQHAFGGQLEFVTFEGTNIILEGNRIVLIKGEDGNGHWSDDAARSDVERVVSKGGRRQP